MLVYSTLGLLLFLRLLVLVDYFIEGLAFLNKRSNMDDGLRIVQLSTISSKELMSFQIGLLHSCNRLSRAVIVRG